MIKITISLFILGLSFGFGPCLASCGPLLVSYIAGTKKRVLQSITVYFVFSVSRISVYVLLGIFVFIAGRFAADWLFGNFSKYVLIIGGGFIAMIGTLMVFGRKLEFNVCQFLEKKLLKQDKKSIIIMGLVIALLPCAPLLAVLSYVGLISKVWWQSLLYSFSFGLGTLISPLILFVILSGCIGRWLEDKRYYRIFSSFCGVIIIFLGIQLISKAF